ncbi:MAG: tetratricopeptide repeat protein [Phycisphaerales bacterium]|nr:tetratricopeptide repeat protein [Phycisphaerales bacterium]
MDSQATKIVRKWNFKFIGCTALVVVTLIGCLYVLHHWQASRITVDHRQVAFQHFEAGEYVDALGHLGHVLRSDPNDLEAVVTYARSVGHLASPSPRQRLAQLSQYRRAITLDPTDVEVAEEGLTLYMRYNLWLEGSEIAHGILDRVPDSRIALLTLARAAMHDNRGDDAQAHLMTLRELHPADDETLSLLVDLLYARAADQSLMQRSATLRTLTEYIQETVREYGERNPKLYLIRARSYEEDGGAPTLARKDYERALDLAPTDPVVCAAAGRFYHCIGAFEDAVRWLGIAIDADPGNHEYYVALARTYADRGAYDEAVRMLEEGLEQAPDGRTSLTFYLAETLLSAGETPRVEELIRELSRAGVPADLTRYLEARISLVQGEPGRAVSALELITDPIVTPLSHFFLAQAYLELGRPEQASGHLRQIPPNQFDPMAIGRLQARVLAATGQYSDALRDVDAMLAETPDDVGLLFLKADGLLGIMSGGEATAAQMDELASLYQQLSQATGEEQSVQLALLKSRVDQLGGGRERAIYGLTQAISHQDDSLELWSELAKQHVLDGDADAALDALRQAPSSVQAQPFYRVLLAGVYEELGDPDSAAAALAEDLEQFTLRDRQQLRRAQAALLQRVERPDDALAVLLQIAGDDPRDMDIRLTLLAKTQVQRDAVLRDRLIVEIKAIEEQSEDGAAGVVWRTEQARAMLLDVNNPDPEQAMALLDEVVRLEPGMAKAHHLRALTLRQLGRLDDAVSAAKRALDIDPAMHLSTLLLIDLYGQLGRPEEVRDLIDDLDRLQGPKPVMLVRQSLTWNLQAGRTGSALDDVDLLIANQPDDAQLRVLRARLLGADDRMEEAIDEASRAFALAPDSPNAAFALIQLALADEAGDLAFQTVDRFEQAAPGSEITHLMRSEIWAYQGETQRALDELSRGAAETASPTLVLALARYLRSLDRPDEALARYEQVDRMSREGADAALEAAELLLALGDPTSAVEKIAEAEHLGAPAIRVADLQLAFLSATQPPGWLTQAAPILEGMRADPAAGPAVFLELSRVYQAQGSLDRAHDVLRDGLHRIPDDLTLSEELGRLLITLGRHDEARILAARLALIPGGGLIGELLQVDVYESQQNAQPAVARLESLMDRYPDDARLPAWRLRAIGLLEQLGEQDEIAAMIEAVPHAERDDALHERWAVHVMRTEGAEQAVVYLEQQLTDDPDSKLLHFVLARMLLTVPSERRDADLLHRVLEEDRRVNPGSVRALLLLAAEARERGDHEAAVEYYREALSTEPSNLLAINNLAWTLGKDLGRLAESITLVEGGLARDPVNRMLQRTYGLLLVDARRWGNALEVWQTLAKQQRTDIWLKLRIVESHTQLGQLSDARRVMGEVRDVLNLLQGRLEGLDDETRQLYEQVQQGLAGVTRP